MMKPRLQVMKFGGTSIGDASCIARTAQIIANAAKENGCVAVVSAMSGVTNRLIEAAKNAQAGDTAEPAAVVDALRKQHEAALTSLIRHEEERARITGPRKRESDRHCPGLFRIQHFLRHRRKGGENGIDHDASRIWVGRIAKLRDGRPVGTRTPDLYRVKRHVTNAFNNLHNDRDCLNLRKYV